MVRNSQSHIVIYSSYAIVPTSYPVGVSADTITETSFRLSWSPPPEEYINGIISSYTISVYEQETEVDTTYSTINTAYIITQLHPFYIYHVSVAASTIATGLFSNATIIRTLQSGESVFCVWCLFITLITSTNWTTIVTATFSTHSILYTHFMESTTHKRDQWDR